MKISPVYNTIVEMYRAPEIKTVHHSYYPLIVRLLQEREVLTFEEISMHWGLKADPDGLELMLDQIVQDGLVWYAKAEDGNRYHDVYGITPIGATWVQPY